MSRHRTTLRTTVALFALVLFVAACGGDDDAGDVFGDVDAGQATDDSGGAGGDDIEDVLGGVDIPDNIPVPGDHEVVQAIGNDEAGYTINLTSTTPAAEVADFYETALPEHGWTGVDRTDTPDEQTGTGDLYEIEAAATDSDHTIYVQVQQDPDVTTIVILSGPPGG